MYNKHKNKISICEDNFNLFLLRCEDSIDNGLISASFIIDLLMELTSTEEEPQSEIDEIIYYWADHIKKNINSCVKNFPKFQ